MAELLRDSAGVPIPQYQNDNGTFEASLGSGGGFNVNLISGVEVLGDAGDAEALLTNGTVVALLKGIQRIVTNTKDTLNTGVSNNTTALNSLNTLLNSLQTIVSNMVDDDEGSAIAADLALVKSSLGTSSDTSSTNTVVGLLKKLIAKYDGATANASVASITVGTAATLISNASNSTVTVFNNGTETVYIGFGNTVAITNGFPVKPDSQFSVPLNNASLYAVASADNEVRVMVVA